MSQLCEAATRRATGRGAQRAMAAIAAVVLAAVSGVAHAEVSADCTFLEISAKTGDKSAMDAELRPVEKKLKKPPFSTWNQFQLLSRSQRVLAKRKLESIPLKVGGATATLVEIVDKSKVRLTVTMDDGKGKQVANNTATVEAGDFLIYVHPLGNAEGHLLSLTCK